MIFAMIISFPRILTMILWNIKAIWVRRSSKLQPKIGHNTNFPQPYLSHLLLSRYLNRFSIFYCYFYYHTILPSQALLALHTLREIWCEKIQKMRVDFTIFTWNVQPFWKGAKNYKFAIANSSLWNITNNCSKYSCTASIFSMIHIVYVKYYEFWQVFNFWCFNFLHLEHAASLTENYNFYHQLL